MTTRVRPDVALAALHHAQLNTERQWATFEMVAGIARIHYGTIHSNGMREIAIATRTYHINPDGSAGYVTATHV